MKRTFDNFHFNDNINAVLRKMSITEPTKVQSESIPLLLSKKDIVVKSNTGTGKTLAFMLPIIENYFKHKNSLKNKISAVIITPTRELAVQIRDVTSNFGISTECFIGGQDIEEDKKRIRNTINVIIGTPGRLYEIVEYCTSKFSKVGYVILDESDKLVSIGFEDTVLKLVSLLPKEAVKALFSATINDNIKKISRTILKNPTFIDVEENKIPDKLDLLYLYVNGKNKIDILLQLSMNKKCIVFVATCNQVDFLYDLLVELGLNNVKRIHGKMKQEERGQVYKDFLEQSLQPSMECINVDLNTSKSLAGGRFAHTSLLICTDVSARGIDFIDIDLVIHFDIPKEYNNIVHRSGRTARNGKHGESIIFVMENEKAYIEFLRLKGINVEEYQISEEIEDFNLKDSMNSSILEKSVKAFVSYVRSYKEHTLNYILDFKALNYDYLAELFMLERIPSMPELRHKKFKNFDKPEKTERIREKKKAKIIKNKGKNV